MKVHRYLLLFVLALVSCKFFHMKSVEIVDYSPREISLSMVEDIEVWVKFSESMNRTSAEEAFSLSEENTQISGSFSWDGQTMMFHPLTSFQMGKSYTIKVDTGAEDEYGNSLRDEFNFLFSIGGTTGRPEVLSVIPANNASIDNTLMPVTVNFSMAVDPASFYSSFSLEPGVNGAFTWQNGGATCIFTPLDTYEWQTEYKVTINSEVASLDGATMAEDYVSRFYVGTDTDPPVILYAGSDDLLVPFVSGSTVSGWEKDWSIIIVFNESIAYDDILSSYFHFEPDWSFELVWDQLNPQQVLLATEEYFAYNTTYTLRLKPGIPDIQGNEITQEETYRFLVDGAQSQPPGLLDSVVFVDNGLNLPGADDVYNMFDTIQSDGGFPESYFDIYFSLAAGAVIHELDFMKYFSLTETNGCIGTTLLRVEINPVNAFMVPDPYDQVVRVYFDGTGITDDTGTVTLGLSDKLEDSFGNRLREKWQFILNKTGIP
jgi:hypothetical protein